MGNEALFFMSSFSRFVFFMSVFVICLVAVQGQIRVQCTRKTKVALFFKREDKFMCPQYGDPPDFGRCCGDEENRHCCKNPFVTSLSERNAVLPEIIQENIDDFRNRDQDLILRNIEAGRANIVPHLEIERKFKYPVKVITPVVIAKILILVFYCYRRRICCCLCNRQQVEAGYQAPPETPRA